MECGTDPLKLLCMRKEPQILFELPALVVANLYRKRWAIGIFFRWIKQHVRIKRFFGTSPNAVKTELWTAIAAHVLVAIMKKRLGLDASLYTPLQYLSVSVPGIRFPLLFRRATNNQEPRTAAAAAAGSGMPGE